MNERLNVVQRRLANVSRKLPPVVAVTISRIAGRGEVAINPSRLRVVRPVLPPPPLMTAERTRALLSILFTYFGNSDQVYRAEHILVDFHSGVTKVGVTRGAVTDGVTYFFLI